MAPRVVIVTGGSVGIGRAAAVAFGRGGARVAVADLDPENGEAAVAAVAAAGGEATFVRTDISRNALQADGSAYGRTDEQQAAGLDPTMCAGRILRAVRRNEAEIYIGGSEVLGVYLNRFIPSLFRKMIRRSEV